MDEELRRFYGGPKGYTIILTKLADDEYRVALLYRQNVKPVMIFDYLTEDEAIWRFNFEVKDRIN